MPCSKNHAGIHTVKMPSAISKIGTVFFKSFLKHFLQTSATTAHPKQAILQKTADRDLSAVTAPMPEQY